VESGFTLARRLIDTYRREKDHKRIAAPLTKLLEKSLEDRGEGQDRLREARLRLRQFEDVFPNSKVLGPLRAKIRDEAKSLFDQAKLLAGEGKKSEALKLLRRAEDTWPELPGLRAYRIQLNSAYQVFKVGMRELPTYMSPARAVTDAELRAVDLLFESLVSPAPEGNGVTYYRPGLSEGRFKVVPLGREFRLPRLARWSDNEELTAVDLRHTVDLLKKGRGCGRNRVWGELLAPARVETDPYRVNLVMQQGFIDPLALMSFKVLPAHADADSVKFAQQPIGSGPFAVGETGDIDGRSSRAFKANPHYGMRDSKRGLPRISEVHFIRTPDPVKDLEKDRIDLALDLTAEQAVELRKSEQYDVPLPGEKPFNRRIYFLAVNNRKPVLSNADFRIALARAIDRDKLLDEHFRKDLGRAVHRAINGPYPARSWACDPTLHSRKDKDSLDLYDPQGARTGLQQVLSKLDRKKVSLKVKYPSGDPVLEKAIGDLCERVHKELPEVTLNPEALSPWKLREDVEKQNFELAYYWYDFPDETFWLMPLLGPTGLLGEKAVGYRGGLVRDILATRDLRDFSKVRDNAQLIHKKFHDREMPFIPLWQLDPLYASKKGKVQMGSFDPHRIFARIERWRVKSR